MRARTPLLFAAAMLLLILGLTLDGIVTEHEHSVATSVATSTQEAATVALATTTAATPPATPRAATTSVTTPQPPVQNLTATGGKLLGALVNIFCVPQGKTTLRGMSGSGVIIDSRGLILTAAHVGEYFLLDGALTHGSVSCTVRTGGPATDAYTASAVYVSPEWVDENPETLSAKAPKGTGENDFAVLAITGSATTHALPSSFPYIPLSSATPQIGEKVTIGSYAAQYLGTNDITNHLFPTIVFDPVSDRFTFAKTSVDVISVAGTAAAQEGSSGGGVADASGGLIGVITTSSITGDISKHVLYAITPLHIRTSFAADEGVGFDTYFSSHTIPELLAEFSSEAKKLAAILVEAN